MGRLGLVDRGPGGGRGDLARYVAPAAFFVAATIAILLVRAALKTDDPAPPSTVSIVSTTRTTAAETTATESAAKTTTEATAVFHTIVSGDTFQQLALDNDTTVEELQRLNPGVDPTALTVGEKIRVK